MIPESGTCFSEKVMRKRFWDWGVLLASVAPAGGTPQRDGPRARPS